MNLSYSPYNLNAFNLDSLRWFVQSMRGLCKKMIGDYPSALKMISSSLQNARFFFYSFPSSFHLLISDLFLSFFGISPSDIGGHLLSMFNLSVLYKHCGEVGNYPSFYYLYHLLFCHDLFIFIYLVPLIPPGRRIFKYPVFLQ